VDQASPAGTLCRKDKGLNGDLDRLPMLTWIMFLKFLDDMEELRKEEANLAGKRFRPAMEAPYRWRDWASKPDGMTGPELIAFINQEEAVRPDGKKGAGLFAYLRSLQSTNGDRRDIIAKVFEGTVNRMVNGYLLRDVINKVNEIHFTSQDEIHTLGHLYESMLREMRDAAGDSGEFYTPRPLVKFIVTAVDPKLGETVLAPAAGTGGSLVESFEHLKKQAKKAEDSTRLQRGSLLGIEPKTLPYLLCQMNLLLHGLEYPEIDPGNALRFPLREIGDKDRVDVIMTNPPFGGEEERGILSNFPEDKQTAETALLFLQLIMRKLRRPVGGSKGGRCGMVVPNGVLFGDGICARIKAELLREFNLHTIVRLPNGVFAPYTVFRRICFSLIAPGRLRRFGTTSSHCPTDERTTPRRPPSNLMNLQRACHGGRSGKNMSGLGEFQPSKFSPTAATSTARTRAPRKTSPIYHRRNWQRASYRRSAALRKLWPISRKP